jgi:hypothetical protein
MKNERNLLRKRSLQKIKAIKKEPDDVSITRPFLIQRFL